MSGFIGIDSTQQLMSNLPHPPQKTILFNNAPKSVTLSQFITIVDDTGLKATIYNKNDLAQI